MRIPAMIILLCCVSALAQTVAPRLTSAEVVKQTDTYTQADTTLYVSTTGSNSFDCRSSAAPCATLSGAIAKLPWVKRHAITINVSAGFYLDNVTIDGIWERAGSLTITGPTMVAAADAGTSVSGTFSAVSNTMPSTYTDSSKSFTTDIFRGMYLVVTGGTGSGGITPIIANTGTVITTGVAFTTAPNTSSTYEIRQPGAVIWNTTATSAALSVRLDGATHYGAQGSTSGRISITGVDFVSTASGGIGCVVASTATQLALTDVRCIGQQSQGIVVANGPVFLTEVVGYGIAGVGATIGGAHPGSGTPNTAGVGAPGYDLSLQRSVFHATGSNNPALRFAGPGVLNPQIRGFAARATAGTVIGVIDVVDRVAVPVVNMTNATTWSVWCDSSSNVGVSLRQFNAAIRLSTLYVSGCGYGIAAESYKGLLHLEGTLTLNNTTTAGISAKKGTLVRTGAITLSGTTPTYEVALDDLAITAAQLDSMVPKVAHELLHGTIVSIE